jgi:hypothetical protein
VFPIAAFRVFSRNLAIHRRSMLQASALACARDSPLQHWVFAGMTGNGRGGMTKTGAGPRQGDGGKFVPLNSFKSAEPCRSII